MCSAFTNIINVINLFVPVKKYEQTNQIVGISIIPIMPGKQLLENGGYGDFVRPVLIIFWLNKIQELHAHL